VSSLAVLAAAALDDDSCPHVLVAQDARMQQVYLEGFAYAGDTLPTVFLPVGLQAVGRIHGLPQGCYAAGAGWDQYPGLWQANESQLAGRVDVNYPHARELVRLGALALQRGGAIPPEELVPAYVRQRVAQQPGETDL